MKAASARPCALTQNDPDDPKVIGARPGWDGRRRSPRHWRGHRVRCKASAMHLNWRKSPSSCVPRSRCAPLKTASYTLGLPYRVVGGPRFYERADGNPRRPRLFPESHHVSPTMTWPWSASLTRPNAASATTTVRRKSMPWPAPQANLAVPVPHRN